MNSVRITGEVPAGLPKAERVQAYAEAIDAGLRAVASSPDMRLRMILGETYNKLARVVDTMVDEIEKDEDKAPGLRQWVLRNESTSRDDRLMLVDFVNQFLTDCAARLLIERAEHLTIEGEAEHVD